MSRRFRLPKDRVVALAADWGLLLLLSYCTYFLINHLYRVTHLVPFGYKVPFPDYAYGVTVIGTLLLALVWENLGESIGWKGVGIAHADADHRRLGLRRRAAHLAAELVAWPLTVLGAALALAPFAGLGALLHGIASRAGLTLIPTVVFWPVKAWPATLGLTVCLVLVLSAIAATAWWSARGLWRWLWPGQKGARAWTERVAASHVIRATDIVRQGAPRRWWRTSWGLMAVLVISLTIYVGWLTSQINVGTLVDRVSRSGYIWAQLARPDFQYFLTPDPTLKDTILNGIIQTLYMALMATLFGLIVAFPLSFLGARNITSRSRLGWGIYTLMRAFFNIGRSIEPLIVALFFGFWVGFGPFAGVLALFIHTIAALGKLFSEQIEAIDPGPVEAITASGGRRTQVLRYGVIPQIVTPFLAFTLYRWDINVRMATIIALVGGMGIGRFFFWYKSELLWSKVGGVLVVIAVVVWTMDYISGRVRERIT